jgi:hypothetical protein
MIVKKRQRRLGSIEDVVLSLSARGMNEWQNHPLDPGWFLVKGVYQTKVQRAVEKDIPVPRTLG